MRGNDKLDWDVLDLDGVREIATQAARRVNRKFRNYTDLADLEQDALLMLATGAPTVRRYVQEENLGGLQHRLEQRLYDSFKYDLKYEQQTVSYDAIMEAAEDGAYATPFVTIEPASNVYTREAVELLLPSVWDESYTYGLPQRDDAPDPDMPRGSTNKATANSLGAYLADIKVGWERASLTVKERRALILAYGLGWKQEHIAHNQGVTQQTISERLYVAIGKIVARLNGGIWNELAGIEA